MTARSRSWLVTPRERTASAFQAKCSVRSTKPACGRAISACSWSPADRVPSPGCESASPRFRALALALGLPVVGVSALDALALAAAPPLAGVDWETLIVWRDAQRGESFAGRYRPDSSPSLPAGHLSAASNRWSAGGTTRLRIRASECSHRLCRRRRADVPRSDRADGQPASPIVAPPQRSRRR